MVGDRERIDSEVAEALMRRLHAAGLELHRALEMAQSAEAQSCIEKAIDDIDRAIGVLRLAAIGFGPEEDASSPS